MVDRRCIWSTTSSNTLSTQDVGFGVYTNNNFATDEYRFYWRNNNTAIEMHHDGFANCRFLRKI